MSVVSRTRLKTSFEKARVIGPLHTGGPLAITQDGLHIVSCVGEEAILTRLDDGVQICRFAGDTETINSMCITPSSSHLLVFTASLSLHIYELPTSTEPLPKAVRSIRSIPRAHEAPVHVCKADPTSTYLASGSADGIVKVFNILRGFVTHVFKGHGGVVSALAFNYPRDASSAVTRDNKMQLITASVDTNLRIFDLTSAASSSGGGRPIALLEGHVSVPRGLDVTYDGRWLISGGRDSVVLVWDLMGDAPAEEGRKSKGKERNTFLPILVKTIPVLDRIEAVGLIHAGEFLEGPSSAGDTLRFYTGGEKGIIQVWDGREGTLAFTLNQDDASLENLEQQRQIVDAFYVPSTMSILSVHADQNILIHSLATRSLSRQLIGFNDEIIDATFLSPSGPDSHLAIAANSSLIRVYSLSANDTRLLSGHRDIVLCLGRGADGRLLGSGGKDKSARIWAYGARSGTWGCVAVCEGHAESIGAITMSQNSPIANNATQPKFMFTGSQDRTLKMWDMSSITLDYDDVLQKDPMRCKSLVTHKAHDKDINTLDIAPNDRLLASGSQDKTAKVYEIDYIVSGSGAVRGDIRPLGICKGHKRGVWTVRFGRTERVLATGSGDKTIKLWNLDDFSCVKTFEGHMNSVLRVDFLNHGMQMVSSSSDGLLKLWNVRNEECMASMDNHEDKIWALAVSADESTVVTGAADSMITFWQDSTEEKQREEEGKRTDIVMKEQDFMNYLSLNDYRNAILLALTMDQPGRLLSLFKSIRSSTTLDHSDIESHEDSITGHPAVDVVIRTLPAHELVKLLKHVRQWNSNAATSVVAQTVLHALLKLRTADDITTAYGSSDLSLDEKHPPKDSVRLNEIIQTLIPYTERHLARMERLIQESYVVDYILGEMDNGMLADEHDMVIDSV